MLSLFCVVLCVLAQLIKTAVHPAAILLRKIRVVGFIEVICRGTKSMERLQSCTQKLTRINKRCICPCVPGLKAWPLLRIRCSVIAFSAFRKSGISAFGVGR
jgi:hypothetical protein